MAPGAASLAASLPAPPATLIVGCPRSGTSLLAAFMESRFGFAVPVETHFIPVFGPWLGLWSGLRNPGDRRALVDAIFQFLDLATPRMIRGHDIAEVKAYSLLAVRPQAHAIAGAAHSYGELVTGLFGAFAALHGRARWADKTAFSVVIPLERLDRCLPGMRVVHIVRDGRDTVLSWMRTWVHPAGIETAARLWAGHVRSKRDWGERNAARYHEVRYEDLVTDPERVARAMAGFLDLPASPDRGGGSVLARAMAKSVVHEKLSRDYDASSVGQWRTGLTPEQVALIEAIAGAELVRFGYAPSGAGGGPRPPVLAARLGALANPIEWQRAVARPLMPPAIRAAQLAGLSLPALLNRGPRFRGWNDA